MKVWCQVYKVQGFIWPILLISYCVVRFVTAEPTTQEPTTQEPTTHTFDTIIKHADHLERECTPSEYQTVRYAVVDYPSVKKLASKFMEDGKLTRAEYIALQHQWTEDHKNLVIEDLKRAVSPESEGWRSRLNSHSLHTD